ncbi:hypothetical protein MKX03_014672, partial [Papaver bracteatum]
MVHMLHLVKKWQQLCPVQKLLLIKDFSSALKQLWLRWIGYSLLNRSSQIIDHLKMEWLLITAQQLPVRGVRLLNANQNFKYCL